MPPIREKNNKVTQFLNKKGRNNWKKIITDMK